MPKILNFNELKVGTPVMEKDCILSEQKDAVDFMNAVLIDETGEIECSISKNIIKDETLLGSSDVVVCVSGSYTKRAGRELLWVTAIRRSDAKITRPNKEALSEEKIAFYTAWLKEAASKVKNPGYQALIKQCVTEEYIKDLATLPATLARDLKILLEHDFSLKKISIHDQFPRGMNIETVILMSNRNIKPDGYIKLEVNTEELDAAKSGISDTSSEDF